jgi:hypothetical protein
LIKIQREAFNEEIESLKPNECVIVLDYTRFHETSAFKLSDLDFTIYFKDQNGDIHHEWIDFFSEHPQDYSFTYEGLTQLAQIIDFSLFDAGVHFWCDNAFKTYGCLYSFYCFVEGYCGKVSVNYFAPHHGYSLCDTHFGKGKQLLRQDYRLKLIHEPKDIEHVFEQLDHTTVIHLNDIPKKELPHNFFQFTHQSISFFQTYELVPGEECRCKENYTSKNWYKIEINP